MPEQDPFQQWLDEYRRDLEATIERSRPRASPIAENAERAFRNWWRAEREDLLAPPAASRPTAARLADPGLSPAERDALLPPDWPAQVERLAHENAQLERRLDAERLAGEAVRERLSELERKLSEDRARESTERQQLEVRLSVLEQKLAAAAEQADALRRAKAVLAESAARLGDELRRTQEDLSIERDKGVAAARQGAEAASRIEKLERERAALRETAAGQDGALQELRKQAAGYQARLVEAKELTDADIALMRQELKFFMEELKIIRNTFQAGLKETRT